MSKRIVKNLVGQKFGKLTPIKYIETKKYQDYWQCICDCGQNHITSHRCLIRGKTKSCGCLYFYNAIGQKRGKLKVVECVRYGKHGQTSLWKCVCDCGKECTLTGRKLNLKKSCGCMVHDPSKRWTGIYDISGKYLYTLKSNAKYRKIKFSLKKEYLWKLYIEQNKKCKLSGINIKFVRNYVDNGENQTASLDRIDSSKGYIEGNVQWVHKVVNRMKWKISEKEFINWCKLISNYRLKTKFNIDFDYNDYGELRIIHGNGWKGYKSISGALFNSVVKGASSRNLDFSITIEDIWNRYMFQDKRCFYSGVIVKFNTVKNKKNSTASIERIDNQKHYTKENVVITHKTLNMMKGDIDSNTFIDICGKVAKINENS